MSEKKQTIPSSFMGYNKDAVRKLLQEKDELLETQRQDIEYLRKELSRFEKNKKDRPNDSEPER
ncbi:MAG: hypothetical protein IJS74_00605 [Clostridia bacterium]|nr:hypothetical protein [Clostridia bacterium]